MVRELSLSEINERDNEIKKVLELVRGFGVKYGLDLPDYSRRFSTDYCSNVVFVDGSAKVYDVEWVRKQSISVGDGIVRQLSEEAISQLPNISSVSDILRGSSWAVATKLVARLLFGVKAWGRDLNGPDFHTISGCHDQEYRFDEEFVKLTGVSFSKIVDRVAEIYEEEYMRYRLWREEDVKSLYRFLFVGAGGYHAEFFEGGALADLLCDEEVLSIDDFVDLVAGIMFELPILNSTEAEYPETRERLNMYGSKWQRKHGDVSCVFSEYVPIKNMDRDLLMWLYGRYVDEHKAHKSVED